jgi:hypothetical protein
MQALTALGLFKLRHREGWKKLLWLQHSYPLSPLLHVSMSGWFFRFYLPQQ